jgi:hypothetical protein
LQWSPEFSGAGNENSQTQHATSGIIASWWSNLSAEHSTEVFPLRWDLVGQPAPEIVLGKGSGLDSVKLWLGQLGIQANDEQATVVLDAIKESALASKGLLSVYDVGPIRIGQSRVTE